MTTRIQAIETQYRGYRMRSRLEARWAVFFDSLGIQWRYESEGFNVNGRPYLPDFFLSYGPGGQPGWGFWVEIKPIPLTAEQAKLIDGLVKGTGHRAFAICGDPWPDSYSVSVFQHYHGHAPVSVPLHKDCHFYEQQRIVDGDSFFDFGLWHELGACSFAQAHCFDHTETLGHLKRAFSEARGARFEHGERPSGKTPPPDFVMPPKFAQPHTERDEFAGKTEVEQAAMLYRLLERKRKEQGIADTTKLKSGSDQ
jgi:hypothetical protein